MSFQPPTLGGELLSGKVISCFEGTGGRGGEDSGRTGEEESSLISWSQTDDPETVQDMFEVI